MRGCAPLHLLNGWLDFLHIDYSRIYPDKSCPVNLNIKTLPIGSLVMGTKHEILLFPEGDLRHLIT
jgi:hypothetical protein